MPFEVTQFQHFVWSVIQDNKLAEQAAAAWRAMVGPYAMGFAVALLLGLLGFFLFAMAYRPRIPRGGLWIPAYGLFGGTPKLYYHTRPPSLLGHFVRSRHRVFAFTKSHRHSA